MSALKLNDPNSHRPETQIMIQINRPCAQSFASYTARLLKIVSIRRPEAQYFSNSFRPISQKLLNLQTVKQQNSGSMR